MIGRDLWIRNEFWYVPTDGPEKNREVYVDRFHEVQYLTNTLRQRLIISVGQGFEKPQGSGVRVTRVRVRVRIFVPLKNPYP